MRQNLFSGKIGQDYKLFSSVCHFDELQEAIGKAVKEHFLVLALDKIEVLEVGPGPGFTTVAVLSAEPRAIITAVDNEPVMLEQAKSSLKDLISKGRVKLVESDALKYLKSVQDETFDAFVSGWTLHNFRATYRESLLKEIYRILKKGSVFVNGDKYSIDDKDLHNKEVAQQMKRFEKFDSIGRHDLKEKWTAHYLADEKPEMLMEEGKSVELMQNIGFCDVKSIYRKHMEAVVTAVR